MKKHILLYFLFWAGNTACFCQTIISQSLSDATIFCQEIVEPIGMQYLLFKSGDGMPDTMTAGMGYITRNCEPVVVNKREGELPFGLFHAIGNAEKEYLYHHIDPTANGGSNFGGILYLLDSLMQPMDTFEMPALPPVNYTFEGKSLSSTIELDNHHSLIEIVNGVRCYVVIGSRYVWYEGSFWHEDSVLIRATSIHLFDVESHMELARFDPLTVWGEVFFRSWALGNGQQPPQYSYPHINVLQVRGDNKIIFSGRYMGVAQLNVDIGFNITTDFVLGEPPSAPANFYMETYGDYPNGNHGCSSRIPTNNPNVLYVSTYSNNTFNGEPAEVQVYKVENDTAKLFWELTPDPFFYSNSGGGTLWVSDSLLSFFHGKGYVSNGTEILPPIYEVWNVFTNTKVLSIDAPSDGGYSEPVAIESFPVWESIEYDETSNGDSVSFTFPRPIAHWEIGEERRDTNQELVLPIDYLDSLSEISVWFETSDLSGFWGVTAKSTPTGIDEEVPNTLRFYPNPTSDIVTIEGLEAHTNVRVMSLSGEVLINEWYDDAQALLDLSGLAPGLYFLELESSTGKTLFAKVIKQ